MDLKTILRYYKYLLQQVCFSDFLNSHYTEMCYTVQNDSTIFPFLTSHATIRFHLQTNLDFVRDPFPLNPTSLWISEPCMIS